MAPVCRLLGLALALALAPGRTPATHIAPGVAAWGPLFGASPMPPFWGTSPLPDRALAGDSALWNTTAPALAQLPFPSRAPPNGSHALTLPFSTNVSAVRILGGWPYVAGRPTPEDDVVYRARNGSLVYRFDLLDARLQPYLDSGVRPSPLVLDNVPFCFVANASASHCTYGQCAGPDNVTEFAGFVGDLVRHLVARHGAVAVETWRFRMGTEADGPRLGPQWTTTADVDVYIALYGAVAAAIREALPTAVVGPSNMAGVTDRSNVLRHFYAAAASQGLPMDFLAMSHYSVSRRSDDVWPARAMQAGVRTMGEFRALGNWTGPIEAMEFGWAGWQNGPLDHSTQQPGVFGAAWRAAAWVYMMQGGLVGAFHWGDGFDDTMHGSQPLLDGQGWLLAMAQPLVGARVTALALDYPSPLPSATYNNTLAAMQGTTGGTTSVLLTLYSAGRLEATRATVTLTVALPVPEGEQQSHLVVTQRQLNVTSSFLDVCHADLAARGMLAHNDSTVDEVRLMATPEGLNWARTQFDRYLALQQASLLPFAVPPEDVVRAASGAHANVTLALTTPSVVLLQLSWA